MKAKTENKASAKKSVKKTAKKTAPKTAAKKTKTYAVDVHWDMAKSFEVEAKSREDAVRKIETAIREGRIHVLKSGFEAMECYDVECVGVENSKGEIEFD